MILAVDVHYADTRAKVAGVCFEDWQDSAPAMELITSVEGVSEYQSGQFYKRELPCILKLLEEVDLQPDFVVVDGFVYLDGYSEPGLGKHLYDALDGKVPIIGIAKKSYRGIGAEFAIFRGASQQPLYVTAVGVGVDVAKEYIQRMHGKHRLPTLLKRVDQLCRTGG